MENDRNLALGAHSDARKSWERKRVSLAKNKSKTSWVLSQVPWKQ